MTLKTRVSKLELVTSPSEEVITDGPLKGMTGSEVAAMMKRADGKSRGLPNRHGDDGDDDGGEPMSRNAA